jgi:hypothetical protein
MNRRSLLFLTGLSLGIPNIVKYLSELSVGNLKSRTKSMPDMSGNISLDNCFEDGFSFQYDYQDDEFSPDNGLQKVTISVRELGNLIVTSGKLIACDSLSEPNLEYYFTKTITSGHYPVFLSIADFQPLDNTRVAYAMLRLSEQPVVRWEIATVNGQQPREEEGEIYGYGVDSGTGCFMDFDVAKLLYDLANPDPVAYESARQVSFDQAWALSSAALDRFHREFADRVIAEMDKNASENRGDWANVVLNDVTGANVITFSSGWGDGGYSSYWGYDAKGNVAKLVTDFALFVED